MIKKITGRGSVLKVKHLDESTLPARCNWSVEKELQWQVDELRRLYKEGERQKLQAERIGEASPFPLLLLDENGVVQWCNQAGGELFLPAGAELGGKRLMLFITPGSFTAFRALLLACLQGEPTALTPLAVRHEDGRIRQLIVDVRRVEAKERKTCVLMAAFDYTDGFAREMRVQRQHQALLQLSEKLLDGNRITNRRQIMQAVLNSALDMTNGDCAYWLYRKKDGQQFETLRWPGDKSRILIDTVALRARQKGQTFLVSDYQIWPARLKITPYVSVQSAMAVLADLNEQESGELAVFSLTPEKGLDPADAPLLERMVKMAQFADEALWLRHNANEYAERTRRLQQLAGVGALRWEVSSNEAHWDSVFAKLTGVDPHGDRRQEGANALLAHVHPADLKTLQQIFQHWRNGLAAAENIRFVSADGSESWVRLAGELQNKTLGEELCITAYALDITAFKHAEMERIGEVRQTMEHLQTEQVMGVVVRLTDCLAEPVRQQQELVERLLLQTENPQAQADTLHRLRAWTAQTDYQLRRLQAYSYFGVGASLDIRKWDVGEIVAEWLDWQDSRLKTAGVMVDWRRTPGALFAMVDRRRFMEALTELLDNALESFAVHGVFNPILTVKLTRDNEQIILTLRDNGPGFPTTRLSNLFRPFQAVSGDGRLGIGLSMVKHIIRLHQGTVSGGNAPEGGALLTIMLPLVV